MAVAYLFEPYPRVIISVPWGWQPQGLGKYVFAGLQRIFRCCCLPTDCSRDSWEAVAVKLRHDAHLSALSHLFGMPGLWEARGQKGASPKLLSKVSVCIQLQYIK
ncbi:hypothetical protein EVAR_91354_1 [Eumeta japonica]|uniref:Uncharacterized protein n=1 Tax=Eumeta variegata TaxID=151549 RepID=A0A4C1TCY8_EUMVA|nr:hypothetical protein EVAR_91354_1 [Eumeta japonica]